ncbi:MAG: hypothetical protein GKR89_30695 [Candidatus Latescibacteria bacterium]|nr:hypothetical protein [Candidatus Latescibacterota bacterium]
MQMVKIGLAQTRQTDDMAFNAEAIHRFVEEAGRQQVQILCFPEAQTVGYRVDISPAAAPCPAAQLEDLHGAVARRCGELGMACILGTEIPNPGGKPYNSALVINEGGQILGVHHKTRLTPLDAVAYSPGDAFAVYQLAGVVVGVVICFEGFRFAQTTEACVAQGAQLIFHPQNNTTRPNDWKIPVHHAMLVTRAAENTVWLASCNACLEPHQNCATMVVAPDGLVQAQLPMKQEQLLVADINVDLATRAMHQYDPEKAAPLLFADTVQRCEYEASLPPEGDAAA